MTRIRAQIALLAGAAALSAVHTAEAASTSYGDFNINLSIFGNYTEAQQQSLQDAANYWESQITGYRTADLAEALPAISISAYSFDIDGASGTLGFGGHSNTTNYTDYGFATPTGGYLALDNADLGRLSESYFFAVAVHEMGHILGFNDTVWRQNGLVDANGADTTYGNTPGIESRALAVYRREFDPDATFIPLEEDFGPGTAYAHWDEALFGNPGAEPGRSTSNPELMTGFLSGNWYVSETTIASFEDIGYATVADTEIIGLDQIPITSDDTIGVDPRVVATPLPGSGLLLLSGLAGIAWMRRKRG